MFKFRSREAQAWLRAWASMAMLVVSAGVCAESVYKCTDADGGIAFQSQPCAHAQQQSTVALAQAPDYASSPTYAVDGATKDPRHKPRKAQTSAPQTTAFECRASDGQVFYRHHGCPHRIASNENAQKKVGVAAKKISREQACTQIHRAGAIGRRGNDQDETVSAYDRNLGRDPCD